MHNFRIIAYNLCNFYFIKEILRNLVDFSEILSYNCYAKIYSWNISSDEAKGVLENFKNLE